MAAKNLTPFVKIQQAKPGRFEVFVQYGKVPARVQTATTLALAMDLAVVMMDAAVVLDDPAQ